MRSKIKATGEIFEYNGEWFQCVEQPEKYDKTVCNLCDFHGIGNCELDRCSGTYRNDKKDVIFKKLEKIGGPYDDCGTILQRFKIYTNVTNADTKGLELHIYSNDTIGIEIKQNKEDMEEKKLNLKPFDIQKAREGKSVCTRDGRRARIICFDYNGSIKVYPIVALVEYKNESGQTYEQVCKYMENGRYKSSHGMEIESEDDLMMLPEMRSGWAKVRKDINLYDTKEEADRKMIGHDEYVTAKVCWEE